MVKKNKIGRTSIYPVTEENFKALLDFYIPSKYPQGILSNSLTMYQDIGITLKDLEICSSQIVNYLEELDHYTDHDLSKCLISKYAIDIYFQPKWPYSHPRGYKEIIAKMVELIEQ
jgi:hypothetical protein